mgnify:CR=1 FL=1
MSAPKFFQYQILQDGQEVQKGTLTGPIIKVGTLHSSMLKLPQSPSTARMHAVIDRSEEGVWRVIDLGSKAGTALNGENVPRHEVLPPQGELQFGDYTVRYALSKDASVGSIPDMTEKTTDGFPKGTLTTVEGHEPDPKNHHLQLLNALIEEFGKLAPQSAEEIRQFVGMWPHLADSRKIKILRMLIEELRKNRAEHEKFAQMKINADLAIGAQGIEDIYDLSPGDALAKAHNLLAETAMAKECLELLAKMKLDEGMKRALESAKNQPGIDLEDEGRQAECFLKGHSLLQDRLSTIVAASSTLIAVAISRAGGGEMSEEKRRVLRAQYEAINSATKG